MSTEGRRLEIGCGPSPREGYEHNDVNPGPHIEHVGAAQDLNFPDGTFIEIYGTGALEHLTYEQAAKFLRKACRWLAPGGEIYLDAPNMTDWLVDAIQQCRSKSSVQSALNGWCRWPGDEHKSGWTRELLERAFIAAGFVDVRVESRSDRQGGQSTNDWHVLGWAKAPDSTPNVRASTADQDGWERD